MLGVLPGIIGSIEAMEAIKMLLGIGEPLVGKLLAYDALTEDFRTLKLRRNPECLACADESRPAGHRRIRSVLYARRCRFPGPSDRLGFPRPAGGLPMLDEHSSIRVPEPIHRTMIAHARDCYPEEACGLLAGDPDGRLTKAYPLTKCCTFASQLRD